MEIKPKHYYVILLVILLIYIILSSRLTLILWSDEVSYLESYITLNKTKHGPFMYYFGHLIFLISKIFTLGNIVFYIYLFKIVSIIFGLLTLILIFLITKNIYDNKTALLATFLCAIMPMFIQFGKAILFEMPQLFFTCAVLYLYILFIKKNDTKLLLIMALCLIISAIIRINGLAPIIPIFFDCVSRKRDKKVIICLVAAVLISVIIHLLYTDYLIGIIIHGLALYMETLNPFIQLNYYMKIFHPIGLILIILSLFFVIFLQDECSEFLLSYILIGFWFMTYFRADSLDIARPHFIILPLFLIIVAKFITMLINKVKINFRIQINYSNFLFFLLLFSIPIFHDFLIKSLGYLPSYTLSATRRYFFIEPYFFVPFVIFGIFKKNEIFTKESYNSIFLVLFLFFLIPAIKNIIKFFLDRIDVFYSSKIITSILIILILIIIFVGIKNKDVINPILIFGISCLITFILLSLHLDIGNFLFDSWVYNYQLTEENLVGYNEYIGKLIPFVINRKFEKVGAVHITSELLRFHQINITYVDDKFYLNSNNIKNLIAENFTHFLISYRELNPELYGLNLEYCDCFPVNEWAKYYCIKSIDYQNCIMSKINSNKICAGVFSINTSYFTS